VILARATLALRYGNPPDFVIPNEVRDLHLAAKLQIPHFVRDDKGKEF